MISIFHSVARFRVIWRKAVGGSRRCGMLLVALLVGAGIIACDKSTPAPAKPKLPADLAGRFDAARSWRDLERVVNFGARPSGSEAIHQTQAYILEQLRATTMQVEEQTFTTNTPRGPIQFKNIIARTRPNCPPRFIIGGHYDTKWFTGFKFVGANDGGSSTAALLEIARVLSDQPVDAWVVFFDGEEAMVKYDAGDGFFGSFYLADQLLAQKRLKEIQSVIILDMVGDKRFRLTIPDPAKHSVPLAEQAFAAAYTLGLRDYIGPLSKQLMDDHYGFEMRRVPCVDLIDFDYGNIPGQNNFWHTERDTIDKCAPESLKAASQIALELVRRLEFQKWPAAK